MVGGETIETPLTVGITCESKVGVPSATQARLNPHVLSKERSESPIGAN